jgi:hypothetical protein
VWSRWRRPRSLEGNEWNYSSRYLPGLGLDPAARAAARSEMETARSSHQVRAGTYSKPPVYNTVFLCSGYSESTPTRFYAVDYLSASRPSTRSWPARRNRELSRKPPPSLNTPMLSPAGLRQPPTHRRNDVQARRDRRRFCNETASHRPG